MVTVRVLHYVIGASMKIGNLYLILTIYYLLLFPCRCTATFDCVHNNKKNHRMNMCTYIEQVFPQIISSDALNTEVNDFLYLNNKTLRATVSHFHILPREVLC